MAHGDITHIEIPVHDMTAATGFYTTLFGWQIAEPPGFEGYPMWVNPNQAGGGGLTSRSEDSTQPRSYVEVDSIDDTLALVIKHGGTVVVDKSPIDATSWWAAFADPDGNVLGITEGNTDMGEG